MPGHCPTFGTLSRWEQGRDSASASTSLNDVMDHCETPHASSKLGEECNFSPAALMHWASWRSPASDRPAGLLGVEGGDGAGLTGRGRRGSGGRQQALLHLLVANGAPGEGGRRGETRLSSGEESCCSGGTTRGEDHAARRAGVGGVEGDGGNGSGTAARVGVRSRLLAPGCDCHCCTDGSGCRQVAGGVDADGAGPQVKAAWHTHCAPEAPGLR